MLLRSVSALGLAGIGLAACTTTSIPPTEVIRYHLGAPIARGTIDVEPQTGGGAASLEFKTYAAAVQSQLLKIGYAPPVPGTPSQFFGVVSFQRSVVAGPPRRSPFSIGLGGGGFSGGRGGGVGLGGGVGIPIGGGGRNEIVVTELSVTINRRADQTPVWEGHARAFADPRKPDAVASAQADKLAIAVFTGFPGESGRTIEIK